MPNLKVQVLKPITVIDTGEWIVSPGWDSSHPGFIVESTVRWESRSKAGIFLLP